MGRGKYRGQVKDQGSGEKVAPRAAQEAGGHIKAGWGNPFTLARAYGGTDVTDRLQTPAPAFTLARAYGDTAGGKVAKRTNVQIDPRARVWGYRFYNCRNIPSYLSGLHPRAHGDTGSWEVGRGHRLSKSGDRVGTNYRGTIKKKKGLKP
jgi:hypothetical protein